MKQVITEDVQDAIALMDIINKESDLAFEYVQTLDVERVGGNTKPQPEALFRDADSKTLAVVEVKNFAYESNLSSDSIIHKTNRVNMWLVEYFAKLEIEGTRLVLDYQIMKPSFNPSLLIKEMQNSNPVEGFTNEYIDLKVHKWKRGEKLELCDVMGINFDNCPNEMLVFRTFSEDVDVQEAIEEALQYEKYADILFSKWSESEWNKKFTGYEHDLKVLLIKVIMRSQTGIAYITEDFKLEDFGKTFMKKYGMTEIVKNVDAVFLHVESDLINIKGLMNEEEL